MGIKGFHTFIKTTYPGCIVPFNNNRLYDYIYIDVNHLLHSAIYRCRNEKDFVKNLYVHLDMILNNFVARKKIILAVDGTSPYAKVILQRKRRLQVVRSMGDSVDINKMTPLQLTPGTKLMYNVGKYLQEYTERVKDNYKFLNVEYVISSTSEPDEGEIKIFNKI